MSFNTTLKKGGDAPLGFDNRGLLQDQTALKNRGEEKFQKEDDKKSFIQDEFRGAEKRTLFFTTNQVDLRFEQTDAQGYLSKDATQRVRSKITDAAKKFFGLSDQKSGLDQKEKSDFVRALKWDVHLVEFHFLPLGQQRELLKELGFNHPETKTFLREEFEVWNSGRRLAFLHRREASFDLAEKSFVKGEAHLRQAIAYEPNNPFHLLSLQLLKQVEGGTFPRSFSLLPKIHDQIQSRLDHALDLQKSGKWEASLRILVDLCEGYDSVIALFPETVLGSEELLTVAKIYQARMTAVGKLGKNLGEDEIQSLYLLHGEQASKVVQNGLKDLSLPKEVRAELLIVQGKALRGMNQFSAAYRTLEEAAWLSDSGFKAFTAFQEDLEQVKLETELERATLKLALEQNPALRLNLQIVSKTHALLDREVRLTRLLKGEVSEELGKEFKTSSETLYFVHLRKNFHDQQKLLKGIDSKKLNEEPVVSLLQKGLLTSQPLPDSKEKVFIDFNPEPLLTLSAKEKEDFATGILALSSIFTADFSETIQKGKFAVEHWTQSGDLTPDAILASERLTKQAGAVLIKKEGGEYQIALGESFERLEPATKLEVLNELDRLGAVAFNRRLAIREAGLEGESHQAQWFYHSAKADLLEGKAIEAQFKFQEVRNLTANRPELLSIHNEAKAALKDFSLRAIEDLKQKATELHAQRLSHLSADKAADTERMEREIQLLDSMAFLISQPGGTVDTLEEAKKELIQSFWNNPTVKEGEVVSAGAESPEGSRSIKLEGGVLKIHGSAHLAEGKSLKIQIGKAGGFVRVTEKYTIENAKAGNITAYREVLYRFPASDQEREVTIQNGQILSSQETPVEIVKDQDEIEKFDSSHPSIKLQKDSNGVPASEKEIRNYYRQHSSDFKNDSHFELLMNLYSKENLETLSSQEKMEGASYLTEQDNLLIETAKQLKERNGSYNIAGEMLEKVFANQLREAMKGLHFLEVRKIKENVEGERAEVEEKVIARLEKNRKEHPEEFRKEYGSGPIPKELIKRMVDQTIASKIAFDLRAAAFKKLDERFSAKILPAEVRAAKEAWDLYKDMMDPTNEVFNLSDQGWDQLIDEVIITVATMPLTMGAGAAFRAGLKGTSLAMRWATQGGLRAFAAETGIVLAGAALEGVMMTGSNSLISGTPFELSAVGHNMLMSLAFHTGGKAWGGAAKALGIGEEAIAAASGARKLAMQGANFLGHTAVSASLDVNVNIGIGLAKESLGIFSEQEDNHTYAEKYAAATLRMVGMHYGSKAFKAVTAAASPKFAHAEEIAQHRAQLVKHQYEQTIQERISQLDPKYRRDPQILKSLREGVMEKVIGDVKSLDLTFQNGKVVPVGHEEVHPVTEDQLIHEAPPPSTPVEASLPETAPALLASDRVRNLLPAKAGAMLVGAAVLLEPLIGHAATQETLAATGEGIGTYGVIGGLVIGGLALAKLGHSYLKSGQTKVEVPINQTAFPKENPSETLIRINSTSSPIKGETVAVEKVEIETDPDSGIQKTDCRIHLRSQKNQPYERVISLTEAERLGIVSRDQSGEFSVVTEGEKIQLLLTSDLSIRRNVEARLIASEDKTAIFPSNFITAPRGALQSALLAGIGALAVAAGPEVMQQTMDAVQGGRPGQAAGILLGGLFIAGLGSVVGSPSGPLAAVFGQKSKGSIPPPSAPASSFDPKTTAIYTPAEREALLAQTRMEVKPGDQTVERPLSPAEIAAIYQQPVVSASAPSARSFDPEATLIHDIIQQSDLVAQTREVNPGDQTVTPSLSTSQHPAGREGESSPSIQGIRPLEDILFPKAVAQSAESPKDAPYIGPYGKPVLTPEEVEARMRRVFTQPPPRQPRPDIGEENTAIATDAPGTVNEADPTTTSDEDLRPVSPASVTKGAGTQAGEQDQHALGVPLTDEPEIVIEDGMVEEKIAGKPSSKAIGEPSPVGLKERKSAKEGVSIPSSTSLQPASSKSQRLVLSDVQGVEAKLHPGEAYVVKISDPESGKPINIVLYQDENGDFYIQSASKKNVFLWGGVKNISEEGSGEKTPLYVHLTESQLFEQIAQDSHGVVSAMMGVDHHSRSLSKQPSAYTGWGVIDGKIKVTPGTKITWAQGVRKHDVNAPYFYFNEEGKIFIPGKKGTPDISIVKLEDDPSVLSLSSASSRSLRKPLASRLSGRDPSKSLPGVRVPKNKPDLPELSSDALITPEPSGISDELTIEVKAKALPPPLPKSEDSGFSTEPTLANRVPDQTAILTEPESTAVLSPSGDPTAVIEGKTILTPEETQFFPHFATIDSLPDGDQAVVALSKFAKEKDPKAKLAYLVGTVWFPVGKNEAVWMKSGGKVQIRTAAGTNTYEVIKDGKGKFVLSPSTSTSETATQSSEPQKSVSTRKTEQAVTRFPLHQLSGSKVLNTIHGFGLMEIDGANKIVQLEGHAIIATRHSNTEEWKGRSQSQAVGLPKNGELQIQVRNSSSGTIKTFSISVPDGAVFEIDPKTGETVSSESNKAQSSPPGMTRVTDKLGILQFRNFGRLHAIDGYGIISTRNGDTGDWESGPDVKGVPLPKNGEKVQIMLRIQESPDVRRLRLRARQPEPPVHILEIRSDGSVFEIDPTEKQPPKKVGKIGDVSGESTILRLTPDGTSAVPPQTPPQQTNQKLDLDINGRPTQVIPSQERKTAVHEASETGKLPAIQRRTVAIPQRAAKTQAIPLIDYPIVALNQPSRLALITGALPSVPSDATGNFRAEFPLKGKGVLSVAFQTDPLTGERWAMVLTKGVILNGQPLESGKWSNVTEGAVFKLAGAAVGKSEPAKTKFKPTNYDHLSTGVANTVQIGGVTLRINTRSDGQFKIGAESFPTVLKVFIRQEGELESWKEYFPRLEDVLIQPGQTFSLQDPVSHPNTPLFQITADGRMLSTNPEGKVDVVDLGLNQTVQLPFVSLEPTQIDLLPSDPEIITVEAAVPAPVKAKAKTPPPPPPSPLPKGSTQTQKADKQETAAKVNSESSAERLRSGVDALQKEENEKSGTSRSRLLSNSDYSNELNRRYQDGHTLVTMIGSSSRPLTPASVEFMTALLGEQIGRSDKTPDFRAGVSPGGIGILYEAAAKLGMKTFGEIGANYIESLLGKKEKGKISSLQDGLPRHVQQYTLAGMEKPPTEWKYSDASPLTIDHASKKGNLTVVSGGGKQSLEEAVAILKNGGKIIIIPDLEVIPENGDLPQNKGIVKVKDPKNGQEKEVVVNAAVALKEKLEKGELERYRKQIEIRSVSDGLLVADLVEIQTVESADINSAKNLLSDLKKLFTGHDLMHHLVEVSLKLAKISPERWNTEQKEAFWNFMKSAEALSEIKDVSLVSQKSINELSKNSDILCKKLNPPAPPPPAGPKIPVGTHPKPDAVKGNKAPASSEKSSIPENEVKNGVELADKLNTVFSAFGRSESQLTRALKTNLGALHSRLKRSGYKSWNDAQKIAFTAFLNEAKSVEKQVDEAKEKGRDPAEFLTATQLKSLKTKCQALSEKLGPNDPENNPTGGGPKEGLPPPPTSSSGSLGEGNGTPTSKGVGRRNPQPPAFRPPDKTIKASQQTNTDPKVGVSVSEEAEQTPANKKTKSDHSFDTVEEFSTSLWKDFTETVKTSRQMAERGELPAPLTEEEAALRVYKLWNQKILAANLDPDLLSQTTSALSRLISETLIQKLETTHHLTISPETKTEIHSIVNSVRDNIHNNKLTAEEILGAKTINSYLDSKLGVLKGPVVEMLKRIFKQERAQILLNSHLQKAEIEIEKSDAREDAIQKSREPLTNYSAIKKQLLNAFRKRTNNGIAQNIADLIEQEGIKVEIVKRENLSPDEKDENKNVSAYYNMPRHEVVIFDSTSTGKKVTLEEVETSLLHEFLHAMGKGGLAVFLTELDYLSEAPELWDFQSDTHKKQLYTAKSIKEDPSLSSSERNELLRELRNLTLDERRKEYTDNPTHLFFSKYNLRSLKTNYYSRPIEEKLLLHSELISTNFGRRAGSSFQKLFLIIQEKQPDIASSLSLELDREMVNDNKNIRLLFDPENKFQSTSISGFFDSIRVAIEKGEYKISVKTENKTVPSSSDVTVHQRSKDSSTTIEDRKKMADKNGWEPVNSKQYQGSKSKVLFYDGQTNTYYAPDMDGHGNTLFKAFKRQGKMLIRVGSTDAQGQIIRK